MKRVVLLLIGLMCALCLCFVSCTEKEDTPAENPIELIDGAYWHGATGDIWKFETSPMPGVVSPIQHERELTNKYSFHTKSVTKKEISGTGSNYPYYVTHATIGGPKITEKYKTLSFNWVYDCASQKLTITYNENDEVISNPQVMTVKYVWEESMRVVFQGRGEMTFVGKKDISDYID